MIPELKYSPLLEMNCKLYGNLICQQQQTKSHNEFKLCSNCYQISFGWVESSLTKKPIPIIYLSWWDACDQCIVCGMNLKFISDCQKFCLLCYIIYNGCRYCLTTNIVFGITDKSQCMKCKRISFITVDIININSGDKIIEEFLVSTRLNVDKIVNCINEIDKNSNPLNIYNDIKNVLKNVYLKPIMEWIPYSQIKILEEIAKGGFGTVYKATWLDAKSQYDDFLSIRDKDKTVAIKKFSKPQNMYKYFLNELKSLYHCYDKFDHIIRYYGITKDPDTKEYMLIMKYAQGGNLHNYLQKKFINIRWNHKLYILWQISGGLHNIHKEGFIHRDFHSGNILLETESVGKWKIGDLGLSQPENSILNNEIYGVIPYIAPEIFHGRPFSKKSDIYSMGMIMWELTTGCKPFAKVEHNTGLVCNIVDGKRPEITNDTPECFSNLIKMCWNTDPSKRPSAEKILEDIYEWAFLQKHWERFDQAEEKRSELIKSKKLGPEKSHSKAIYTSRPLSFFISYLSNLSSISFNTDQEYMTIQHEFDI